MEKYLHRLYAKFEHELQHGEGSEDSGIFSDNFKMLLASQNITFCFFTKDIAAFFNCVLLNTNIVKK
jgi:hypothetical protein